MAEKIAILHFTAPPVVGGVEAVIQCHIPPMLKAGKQVSFFAGRGEASALPAGVDFQLIPEMDTRHLRIVQVTAELVKGRLPAEFDELAGTLESILAPRLASFDHVIAHNIFTTYFNLPLTIALWRLLDKKALKGFIAWCHDFTWSSPTSRDKVHPGYPWDSLRTYRPDVHYVTVSQARQTELAELLDVPLERIKVIYNGVDEETLLGLTLEGEALFHRLGVWRADLVLILPVRVTRAKKIDFAFRVVAALKATGRKPLLIVTGPPDPHAPDIMEYFAELKKLRSHLGIEKEARFVYESGPDADQPFIIDSHLVGELYRVSDALIMPSDHEGFGMPVLEAGLNGIPVFATDFPSSREIGRKDIFKIDKDDPPEKVADLIQFWADNNPVQRFRRRVRQEYTWQTLFDRDILPLLNGDHGGTG
jgi:glycosyltransferase involved in cell wall biosynthesis